MKPAGQSSVLRSISSNYIKVVLERPKHYNVDDPRTSIASS